MIDAEWIVAIKIMTAISIGMVGSFSFGFWARGRWETLRRSGK